VLLLFVLAAALAILLKISPAITEIAVGVAPTSEFATLEAEGVDFESQERCEMALTAARRIAAEAGVDLKVQLSRGHPAGRLLAVVRRESPDLVVVGTRGLSRSRKLLLGSVSDAVLRHAPCAVLVVR